MTPRPTEHLWRMESASLDSLRLLDIRRRAQTDEWKLGYESLSRQSCAVVLPADQPAKDTVNQRGEVPVPLLVVGEGCFGFEDRKLSMD